MEKKKVKQLSLIVFSLLLVAAVIGGCSYYRVTDPTTGKDYYTTEVKELRGGAVKLKDDKTQRTITVTNSEIEKISESEYKQGLVSDKQLDTEQTESEEKQSESKDAPQSEEK